MKMYKTGIENFTIRFAVPEDTGTILEFIRELADYEKLLNDVTADIETLHDSLFIRKAAEVIIGEYDGHPVSFALFFGNFSTFLGKPGIYIEDLYVKPEKRGAGIGKVMLSFVAGLAQQRGCGRLEWWCLDWNTDSIGFYKKLGAVPMEDWTVYRLTGDPLISLAGWNSGDKTGSW